MKQQLKLLIPFSLTGIIILVDQLTKILIVKSIPVNTLGISMMNGFFRIIHVRNPGIAFSMGDSLPDMLRKGLFIVLPLVVLTLLIIYYFKTAELNRLQRWILTGILGGGVGNIIDRIFRPDGVVDFLDFRFYGLFGMERFPTFNVADMSVVICGILLVISIFLEEKKSNEQKS